jgi:hypothetical protein
MSCHILKRLYMKVSLLLVVCLALESCLPATLHETSICDSVVPDISVSPAQQQECGDDKQAGKSTEQADKTLMMYRMLHAF